MSNIIHLVSQEGEAEDAAQLCAASKVAYDNHDIVKSLELARRAVIAAPGDSTVLQFTSWLFDVTAATADAIDSLIRLSVIEPLTPSQAFQLSLLYCRQTNFELGATHAMAAVRGDPVNPAYARHCGGVLLMVNRPEEAARIFIALIQTQGDDPNIFYQLSFIGSSLKRNDIALAFALKACEADPGHLSYALHYAGLLMADGLPGDALALLERFNDDELGQPAPSLLRGTAYVAMAAYSRALDVFTHALKNAPENVDILMNRGSLLCTMGRYEEAASDFKAALHFRPHYYDAQKACFIALTQAGLYADAVPYGAGLLHDAPDDESVGRTMQFVLSYRFSDTLGDKLASEGFFANKRLIHGGTYLARPTPPGRLANQFRIINALLLREVITRFGKARLGYFWALFEPLAHIGLMVTLINVMSKGPPPIGDSFAVFYFTGIIPYHLVTHTASALMHSVQGNKFVLQIPSVTTLDIFVSRAILEFVTEVSVALILMAGLSLLGFHAMPINILGVFQTFLLLWGVGFGLGVMNACILSYMHSWEKIWGASISILYFSSGTFFIPSMMPVWLRNILVWNPILQGIELLRRSFFLNHNPPWLDVHYLSGLALGFVTLALILERVLRKRLILH